MMISKTNQIGDPTVMTETSELCSPGTSSCPCLSFSLAPAKVFTLIHILYHTCAIITHGLYTFHPLFEAHVCTVTFGLMYG